MPIISIESIKINVEDRIFSLIQHIGNEMEDSFSLQVSYKDFKKSKGFVNDSLYFRNKEEIKAVLSLLTDVFNKRNL